MYVGYPPAAGEPPKVLRGFGKTLLQSRETMVLTATLTQRDLRCGIPLFERARISITQSKQEPASSNHHSFSPPNREYNQYSNRVSEICFWVFLLILYRFHCFLPHCFYTYFYLI